MSQAATSIISAANIIFAPMGASTGQAYTYSATSPVSIELAYPTYSPSISHWGTSVIMDGRYDDDKSLLFTYGQRSSVSVAAGATRALMSIRVAPSVDNGVAAPFGARELVNRMQLILRALDVTTSTAGSTLLVSAILNGTPANIGTTVWRNVVQGSTTEFNSSLSQIADYSTGGGAATVTGGEITGGFFVNNTTSVSLETVRDLGNAILGGGGTLPSANIYPDGPDVLTITVTNLGASTAAVLGRLSWTEAQA